jgi:hypothetical protein
MSAKREKRTAPVSCTLQVLPNPAYEPRMPEDALKTHEGRQSLCFWVNLLSPIRVILWFRGLLFTDGLRSEMLIRYQKPARLTRNLMYVNL